MSVDDNDEALQRSEAEREFLEDNDSLYVLPLKYMPLETGALRRGRLVKTFSLNSAIEMFKTGDYGRGIIMVEDLVDGSSDAMFGWECEDGEEHPDVALLRLLGDLHSYDIFNLRINLRDHNIDYEGKEYLQLSGDMKAELAVYMRQFTLPLIQTVFGEGEAAIYAEDDIADLFRNPDSADAIDNLRRLSKKLGVKMSDIPRFLDEFSDVYLAVSYYKHYADSIAVMNSLVMQEMDAIHESLKWKCDPDIEKVCTRTKEIMKSLFWEVYQRLDVFERETKDFWGDLNANRFRDVQWLVRDSQTMIAGVLCGLGVKLARWRERFPTSEHGSANLRFEALQNEFLPGLRRISRLAAADVETEETEGEARRTAVN
tara:strand:+ start:302 stop:1417 length:1116 start_codon:yes stop_codon:yes gene_type:complete